ncbi:MAG: hypothetical protein CMM49_05255 [Rhodospirillaceae bacterium]|nr:hypothetical protein [Rhodospirillaceae bacterium]|tara:strand:- start:6697 stop:7638 length:942 start_codon:yes stop_codon:yes gene_type:complete
MVSKNQDILCACFDIKKSYVTNYLKRDDANIEYLYSSTKIGSKCTACLADIDLLLSNTHDIDSVLDKRIKDSNEKFEIAYQGRHPDERLDSGIFFNDNGMTTSIVLANHNPLFRDTDESVDHKYHIRLFSENGQVTTNIKGLSKVGQTLTINLIEYEKCPKRGWYLISLLPLKPGFYGTLRPQILVKGNNWALTTHVQPHIHASYGPGKLPRRSHMYIKSVEGKTNTSLSIINASNKQGDFTVELSEDDYLETYTNKISPNGSVIVDLDKKIACFPEDGVLLIAVRSSVPTRKHIIMESENGTISMDHFPNTV